MIVRRVHPADQDAVRRLILQGLGEHFGFVDETLNPDLEDIQRTYVDAGGAFFVAEEDGEIVGAGCLLYESETEGRIVRMSTAGTHRRKGVASQILRALIGEGKRRGLKSIIIATEPHWSDAVGFYRNNGFVQYGADDVDIWMRLLL